MPEGFVATPCRAMRAVLHADSVSSSHSANVSVSRSSVEVSRRDARLETWRAVAETEGKGRNMLVVFKGFIDADADADNGAEIMLAML